MSTLTPTRKVSRRHELREDKVFTFSARLLQYFEENRTTAYAVFGGLVVIVALSLYYVNSQSSKNAIATSEMAAAVSHYEAGEYAAALDGDITFNGLLEVVEKYGGTDAGNLARFYAADALFKNGQLDQALVQFEAFNKKSDFLGASAVAGEAAIYESRGDFEKAAGLFMRAANLFPSKVVAPGYLLSAGAAYEAARNKDAALRAYSQLKDDYSDSAEARDIDFFIGRVSSAS